MNPFIFLAAIAAALLVRRNRKVSQGESQPERIVTTNDENERLRRQNKRLKDSIRNFATKNTVRTRKGKHAKDSGRSVDSSDRVHSDGADVEKLSPEPDSGESKGVTLTDTET